MPFNDMTVRWTRYFRTAGAQHSNGRKFEVQIPQGYHAPHCVGNPHWRIPNSSVRTKSSVTRRTASLSLKKLTELYEISNGAGETGSTSTYGDGAPFSVRRGAEGARRADRGEA